MSKLEDHTNFWLFLIEMPMGSRYKVYDCRKAALRSLLGLSSSLAKHAFYIVDKKYHWMLYIKMDHETDLVEIFRSKEATVLG